MKRQLFWVLIACTVFAGFLARGDRSSAQQNDGSLAPTAPQASLLTEDFEYTAGTALTSSGFWSAHSAGGTNPILVSNGGLTYPGYAGSGVGNAASVGPSGEDDNRLWAAPVNSGSIYAAALVNVSNAQATGDYFFHLFQSSSIFYGRVFAKKDPSSTNYAFGIVKGTGGTLVYQPTYSNALGSTHLIVVKYTFNSGSTTDDTVDLFIDPVLGGAEPAPSLSADITTVTVADSTGLLGVALRQGSTTAAPTEQVDGIRAGTSWADVTGSASSAPAITSVSPNSGPTTGGTSVTITGTNFTGATAVSFGGTAATSFTVNSATSITATSPARSAGTVDITVTTSGGTSSTSAADQFTYTAAPTPTPAPAITSVSPTSGPDTGGTSVVITGTNFSGATAVSFGGTAATSFTVNSGTQITATSPAHAAGAVDIRVTTSGGTSAITAGDQFTYTATVVAHPQHVVDFDGDGKTDFTVIRDNGANAATWYTRLNDGTNANYRYQDWGLASTDYPEPADFDGDNKTDYAIWRPELNGTHAGFWILNSKDGTVNFIPWGQQGDDPSVIGDYDGDGKTDAAIARYDFTANTTTWWFRPSGGPNAGATFGFRWGYAADYPYPGDFNGDGKADFAVTRDDGTGVSVVWVHYGSGDGNNTGSADMVERWGYFASDYYVPGDFDGDGKTDLAVVRNAGGQLQWWVRNSTDGSVHETNWGAGAISGVRSDDLIVQGDYDGDGKTDPAVWRRSDGTFYVLGSKTGTPIYSTWGAGATDTPAAGYNVQ